ncbi:4252_t:CDS:10 [Entrophospora sp. SA101]|nr:4252_t:CDS:10 [Entrophospora sp. SA101]
MTTDQNSEELARVLLSKATENPWLIPSIVNPALQGEILLHILKNWRSYNSKEKLAILFLIFCIKRSTVTTLEKDISDKIFPKKIILEGSNDLDEWVRLVSKMMIDYPKTGVLDLAVEKYLPEDIRNGLKQLIDKRNKEIKFHPVEYAFMDRNVCDSFSMISKDSESETFKPTPAPTPPLPYFILRPDYEISREQRLNVLNNLPTVPMSPGLISPISTAGFFNMDSNRAHTLQNIPQNTMVNRQTPSQHPSLTRRLSHPYPRTNPSLPGFTNGPSGAESPTEIKITQGKKYQKETRIQILDITTGSSIIRNQEETKLKTQLARLAKEREKQERATAKVEAMVAAARTETSSTSTSTASETAKRQGSSGYPKRKKLNDETEEMGMEEIITEGENSHKDTQIMFSSPKSPLSPSGISNDPQIKQSPTSPINENVDEKVMQDILEDNNNSQNIDLSSLNIRLPQRIIEILDSKTKEERQQTIEHIYKVLEKANMLDEQNRELIIYFLADLHNEVKGQLINISDGISGPDDDTRRLDLNVERITRYDEGKEIHEIFIFEMNLADGTWRKLKKTKTKLVKNKIMYNLITSHMIKHYKFDKQKKLRLEKSLKTYSLRFIVSYFRTTSSSSLYQPLPPLPTNMSNHHSSTTSSSYSTIMASPYTRAMSNYPLNSTATAFASGSSTRSAYTYSQTASSDINSYKDIHKNKQSKSIPVKPKLPNYLVETSFADLYNEAEPEAFANNDSDKLSFEALALPTAWNVEDKCNHLNVEENKLKVNYTGSGKSDSDAAAIRANHPIPPQCGLFYFEVEIINKGKDGYIGIGFCTKSVALNRLPGWEQDSWGYHGDDGHSFCCSGTGKPYGPTFTTGDIIGCCLNFRDNTAFYTKNGKHLGIAFRDLKGTLYPSIGLRTQGESLEVNFGQKKFKYSIEDYVKAEKERLWKIINAKLMPPISPSLSPQPPSSSSLSANNLQINKTATETNLTSTVHQLIISYLIHHGYSEAAKVFSQDATRINSILNSNAMEGVEIENTSFNLDKDMLNRQRIRDSVLKGDIDDAIKLTNKFYPSVLPSNDDILFQLRCRKFIEMMRECAGSQIMSSDEDDVAIKKDKKLVEIIDEGEGENNGDDIIAEDDDIEVFGDNGGVIEEDSDDNDKDDNLSNKNKKTLKRRKGPEVNLNGLGGMIESAVRFGQELQDDYRDDTREEETFSLLAYTDPRESVVSYLLDPSEREPVANALNSAILVSQGKPAIPPLEQIYRQTSVALNELSRNGVGSSALVNIRKNCLI